MVRIGGGIAIIQGSAGKRQPGQQITAAELIRGVIKFIGFCIIAILCYSPFGTRWINNPSSSTIDGWDTNRTSASWGTDEWNWDVVDCIYFAMVTMTTVGYGDNPTLRQEMRLFTTVFGFVGVTVIAGAITLVADWISEKGRKRFIARQRRVLKEAHETTERMRRMEARSGPTRLMEQSRVGGFGVGGGGFERWVEDEREDEGDEISAEAIKEIERNRKSSRAQRMWRIARALRLTGVFFLLCLLLGELENSYIPSCGFLSGWGCGSPWSCEMWKLGAWQEDAPGTDRGRCWTWVDQIYYGVITYVTIGYGDVSPTSKLGKLLAAFIVVFGLLTFSILIAELNDMRHSQRLGAEKTLFQRLDELNEVIDADNDGTVSQEEFIIFNLKAMGSVDEDTIALLRDQFKALDADGSGSLDSADIKLLKKASVGLGNDRARLRGSSSTRTGAGRAAGATAPAASDKGVGGAEGSSTAFTIDSVMAHSMSRRSGPATGGPAPASLTDRTLTYLDQTRLDSSELSKYLQTPLSGPASCDANRTDPSKAEAGGAERAQSPLLAAISEGLPFFGGASRAPTEKGSSQRSAAAHAAAASSSARVEQMLERVLVNQEKLLARMERQRAEAEELESLVRRRSDVQEHAVGQLGREVTGLRSWVQGNALAKLNA